MNVSVEVGAGNWELGSESWGKYKQINLASPHYRLQCAAWALSEFRDRLSLAWNLGSPRHGHQLRVQGE